MQAQLARPRREERSDEAVRREQPGQRTVEAVHDEIRAEQRTPERHGAQARGGRLQATGLVVRAGKRIIVTSAIVTHVDEHGKNTDCAVMQQTLVPVAKAY